MAYYSMSQVIKMRRKAMGHSRYEYDVEGPSAMAVYRLEEKSIWVSERAYRKLTKAMGEEESTRRGVIKTKDIRVLELLSEILCSLFNMDYTRAEELIGELELKLDCTVKRNQQYLGFLKAELSYKQEKSTETEYKESIKQGISYGEMKFEHLLKKQWPFKEREWNILQKLVEIIRKEKDYELQKCLLHHMKDILENEYMEKEYRIAYLVYIRCRLGDLLGNLEQYRMAIQMDEETISLCKEQNEQRYMAHIYYDIFWNYWNLKKKETLTVQEEERCRECLLNAYYINKVLHPMRKRYEEKVRECFPDELL